jgi:hypothetical protein
LKIVFPTVSTGSGYIVKAQNAIPRTKMAWKLAVDAVLYILIGRSIQSGGGEFSSATQNHAAKAKNWLQDLRYAAERQIFEYHCDPQLKTRPLRQNSRTDLAFFDPDC